MSSDEQANFRSEDSISGSMVENNYMVHGLVSIQSICIDFFYCTEVYGQSDRL